MKTKIKTRTKKIAELIAAIESAKNHGDYHSANAMFALALATATNDKRDLSSSTLFAAMFVETDGGDETYDLLDVYTPAGHTCIPLPKISEDIKQAAYTHCSKVARFNHCRHITDEAIQDVSWKTPRIEALIAAGEAVAGEYFKE